MLDEEDFRLRVMGRGGLWEAQKGRLDMGFLARRVYLSLGKTSQGSIEINVFETA